MSSFDFEKWAIQKVAEQAMIKTVKDLSDEEIKQIFQEQTGFHFDDNPADDLALMDFARAILRKANEK
jgi:predicted HTH transcriptional regulator